MSTYTEEENRVTHNKYIREVTWIIILLHVATIEICVQFHILMSHVKFFRFVQKS